MSSKSIIRQVQEQAEQLVSDEEDEFLLNRSVTVFFCVLGFAFLALVFYFVNFHGDFADHDKWGQFGDFLGGVLNPAIGMATVYLVLVSIRMQKKELRFALKEMKNSNSALAEQNDAIEVQTFQNTFFNWLGSYRDIVKLIERSNGQYPVRGAAALLSIYNEIFNRANINFQLSEDDLDEHMCDIENYARISNEDNMYVVEQSLLSLWQEMSSRYGGDLDPMLGSIKGLIQWIENTKSSVPQSKRREYLRILSSQLSPIELKFILLNLLGNNLVLLERLKNSGFFKNIVIGSDPVICFLMTHGHYADETTLQ